MADQPSYSGSDTMNKVMDQFRSSAEEFSRMFGEMKFPTMVSADALVAAHKRNVEALTAANRVAVEGAQAVAKRHLEIVQQTMGELSQTMQSLTSSEAPQDKVSRQTEALKVVYERAVAHTRELGELIQHSNTEALKLLNQRFVEAMHEVKALVAEPPAA